MSAFFIVELTDDTDSLVGYGVCVQSVKRLDHRTSESNYTMLPEVYGVRSQADAALVRAERESTTPGWMAPGWTNPS